MKINFKYGWRPDLPDHRDITFKRKAMQLPPSVDLSGQCSAVENQLNIGSCTANALVGALEFNEKHPITETEKATFVDLSRLFVYFNERMIEGTIKEDSGAQIRDGIKVLAKYGVCTEILLPYNTARFTIKPSSACYRDARKRRITSYQRIQTLEDMKQCLAGGRPFVFGFTVYDSFESATVAKTGVVNMPTSRDTVVGGHAVCCVGYDDATKRVLVRNSWGPEWGMKGYFTMPYEYIINQNLATDMWTIQK